MTFVWSFFRGHILRGGKKHMISSVENNMKMWGLLSILALFTATSGVIYRSMYDAVVSDSIMPGVLSQDLMTIALSLTLLWISMRMKRNDSTKQLIGVAILIYLFYGYGIYVIEQLYTIMYFTYMAIFALATYSLISVLMSIGKTPHRHVSIDSRILRVGAFFLLINAVMFYIIWSSQIIPLIQDGEKLEFLFSIYILDLCFIMPAFIICALRALKGSNTASFLVPSLLLSGFMILAPLSLGELLRPVIFDLSIDVGVWRYSWSSRYCSYSLVCSTWPRYAQICRFLK